MREIYSSPRPENIDRVVALFTEHGIETRIANRSVYDRRSYQRFSYGRGENRANWARVEVKYAKDLTRARALLKDLGIAPMTRFAEELEFSRKPQQRRSPRAIASRIRMGMLVIVVVAVVILFLRMSGIS